MEKTYSWDELKDIPPVDCVIHLAGKAHDTKNIPEKPVRFSAKVGDYLHLPLNSERLKKLTESYVVSNQKIKKALGIEKMQVTVIEGLKKTFESFQK